MRARVATLGVLAAVVLTPAAADAHSLVRSGGGLVSYLSEDATSLNTLSVRPDGNRIEFHDPTVDNGMDPGSCTPGQVAGGFIIQVFCPAAGVSRVRIDLRDREDTAVVSIPIAVTLLGGAGADRLTAGPGGDEVDAGEGNDIADGGDGDDTVDGGPGVDSIAGGTGADRLISRDGLADSVTCGDGADVVDADTVDEVAGDCEEVSRTFTPPPSGGADEPGPPKLRVGAETIQRPGSSRRVRVFATSSEPGTVGASGFLSVNGLNRPIKAKSRRVEVGGAGVAIDYEVPRKRWDDVTSALRRGRAVSIRLGVVATDLAGNSSRRNAPRVHLALRKAKTGKAGIRRTLARHPEPGDADGDGIWNDAAYAPPGYALDNCPTVKNGSQVDTDGDGQGDACDADDDGDGDLDTADNCPTIANPDQEDDFPPAGFGNACDHLAVDTDLDGLYDFQDNCPDDANAGQEDLDGDEHGDACDNDMDGDGVIEFNASNVPIDNCPTVYNKPTEDLNGDGNINFRDQADGDGDGVGTACDPDELALDPDPPPADATPLHARARAGRTQRLAQLDAGVIVAIRCSEACTATSELVLGPATAARLGLGRRRTIAAGSAELDGPGRTYAFVTAGRRARAAIRRADGPVPARLVTRLLDGSANPMRISRKVALGG